VSRDAQLRGEVHFTRRNPKKRECGDKKREKPEGMRALGAGVVASWGVRVGELSRKHEKKKRSEKKKKTKREPGGGSRIAEGN